MLFPSIERKISLLTNIYNSEHKYTNTDTKIYVKIYERKRAARQIVEYLNTLLNAFVVEKDRDEEQGCLLPEQRCLRYILS